MEQDAVSTEVQSTTTPDSSPSPEPKTESKVVQPETHIPKEDKAPEKPVHQKKPKEPKKEMSAKDFYSNIKKEKGFDDKIKLHGDVEEPSLDAKPDEDKEDGSVDDKPKDDGKFVPTFKFKVKDKEHDFPEWAKPFITSKEAEKNFTDLFTKAEGIEAIKESRAQTEQRAIKAEERVGHMENYVQTVLSTRDKGLQGDFRSMDKFFKHMKISDADVVRHAKAICELNNLPPEQKALYDSNYQAQDELDERETQYNEVQQMLRETNAKAKSVDLNLALAKAENAKYAENYEKVNELPPGTFRTLIMKHGESTYLTTGKDLTADEAINELKAKLGRGYIPQEVSAQAPTAEAPKVVEPPVKKDLPVIPNIRSTSVSHVQKQVRTTADLRRIAREKSANA